MGKQRFDRLRKTLILLFIGTLVVALTASSVSAWSSTEKATTKQGKSVCSLERYSGGSTSSTKYAENSCGTKVTAKKMTGTKVTAKKMTGTKVTAKKMTGTKVTAKKMTCAKYILKNAKDAKRKGSTYYTPQYINWGGRYYLCDCCCQYNGGRDPRIQCDGGCDGTGRADLGCYYDPNFPIGPGNTGNCHYANPIPA